MKKGMGMAALALTLILSGCGAAGGGGFSPAENTIYVAEDGSLSTGTVEPSSSDAYSEEELRAFAEQAVADFNAEQGREAKAVNEEGQEKLPVAVQSCEIKDGTAIMILDYGSSEALVGFSQAAGVPVTSIQVSGASEAASLDKPLRKAEGGEKVSLEAAAAQKGTLVQIEGAVTVQTAGKILYATEGVEITDSRSARIPEDGGAVIFQ